MCATRATLAGMSPEAERTDRTATLDVYEDVRGEWRWRVKAANGEPVLPGEGHRDRTDAVRAFRAAVAAAVEALAALDAELEADETDGVDSE